MFRESQYFHQAEIAVAVQRKYDEVKALAKHMAGTEWMKRAVNDSCGKVRTVL